MRITVRVFHFRIFGTEERVADAGRGRRDVKDAHVAAVTEQDVLGLAVAAQQHKDVKYFRTQHVREEFVYKQSKRARAGAGGDEDGVGDEVGIPTPAFFDGYPRTNRPRESSTMLHESADNLTSALISHHFWGFKS